jgi:hypothetical protein
MSMAVSYILAAAVLAFIVTAFLYGLRELDGRDR